METYLLITSSVVFFLALWFSIMLALRFLMFYAITVGKVTGHIKITPLHMGWVAFFWSLFLFLCRC